MLLPIHAASATLTLASGTDALVVRKGSPLHSPEPRSFVFAMLAMCVSAVVEAVTRGQTVSLVGTLAAYLVITGVTTVPPPAARSHAIEVLLMMSRACSDSPR